MFMSGEHKFNNVRFCSTAEQLANVQVERGRRHQQASLLWSFYAFKCNEKYFN